MKTIRQALKDEIHYPLGDGFIDNRLSARNLDGDCEISSEVLTCKEFVGAVADCLYSLYQAPNISDAGMSISLTDKDKSRILKWVNSLYRSIGENEKDDDEPKVYIGW